MATALALAKIEQPSGYEAAKQRWETARSAHRALHDRLAGAKAALGQLTQPEDDDAPPRSPRLAAMADGILAGRRASSARLSAEIAELQEQVEDAAARLCRGRDAWDLAAGLEQHRVSEAARPELTAAARRDRQVGRAAVSRRWRRARELTGA